MDGIYVKDHTKATFAEAFRSQFNPEYSDIPIDIIYFDGSPEVWGIVTVDGERISIGYVLDGSRLCAWPNWDKPSDKAETWYSVTDTTKDKSR